MRPVLIALISAVVGAAVALLVHGMIANRGKGVTQQRVLAEAINSYSDTGQFYLVAATTHPFTPAGYYHTRGGADSAATGAGGSYRTFGPYQGLAKRDPWQVLAITVRVRTDSGERDLKYDPRIVDAVFLSTGAVRKFMLPYYERLYGRDVANAVEATILGPIIPQPPCHAMSVPCASDTLFGLPTAAPRR
ncbi:MAG TPA: hypothetical protein VL549_06355 [Gemmatimonadales bacterium]|nr:hypothetical protein [Gemmatimonadales bacterium]